MPPPPGWVLHDCKSCVRRCGKYNGDTVWPDDDGTDDYTLGSQSSETPSPAMLPPSLARPRGQPVTLRMKDKIVSEHRRGIPLKTINAGLSSCGFVTISSGQLYRYLEQAAAIAKEVASGGGEKMNLVGQGRRQTLSSVDNIVQIDEMASCMSGNLSRSGSKVLVGVGETVGNTASVQTCDLDDNKNSFGPGALTVLNTPTVKPALGANSALRAGRMARGTTIGIIRPRDDDSVTEVQPPPFSVVNMSSSAIKTALAQLGVEVEVVALDSLFYHLSCGMERLPDQTCSSVVPRGVVVSNTKTSNCKGSHWVTVLYTKSGEVTIVDSKMDFPGTTEMAEKIRHCTRYTANVINLDVQLDSVTCGGWAVLVAALTPTLTTLDVGIIKEVLLRKIGFGGSDPEGLKCAILGFNKKISS